MNNLPNILLITSDQHRADCSFALQGRNLSKLLSGDDGAREAAWSEWHAHASRCGVALKLRTVRTRQHKCTVELDSGASEPYDLVDDPHEMRNLYDDPGSAAAAVQHGRSHPCVAGCGARRPCRADRHGVKSAVMSEACESMVTM